jgi:DNA-binding CsgD family transcriptional regulator
MGRFNYTCEQLIDDVYDAGARPQRWPTALSRLASAVGAEGAVMFGFSRTQCLVLEHNGSLDPGSSASFKARHLDNAWVRGMTKRPTDCLVLSDELIRLRELKRSAFFDDVLKSGRLGHAALCTLTAGSDVSVQFSVHKTLSNGIFNSSEILILRRLLPHLRRALGVSLRLKLDSASEIESVSERLMCAAFTLNRKGEVIDVNLRAHHLVANCDSFSISSQGIRFRDSNAQHSLLQAIKHVFNGAPLTAVCLTDGRRRFDVVAVGLNASKTQCPQDAAVVILVDERYHPGVQGAFQCAREQLTSGELRVARIAMLGVSSLEISRSLQLSLNTVKTHLRRVYQKLGVHRQGELVALLGSSHSGEQPD